jgi:hypothetical protein
VKYAGATHIIGPPRREWIDQAAQHGLKVMITFGKCWSPDDPMYATVYSSKEKLKAHIDKYNITQYRNHPGIWAYNICGEPFNNLDAQTDQLVDTLIYGINYIRSLDPTHPVTIQLDAKGGGREDQFPKPDSVEKRKAWISRFIDHVDFITYDYYRFTRQGVSGGSGTEFWREPEYINQDWWIKSGLTDYRTALVAMLDQVLIPASKGKPIVIGETGCPTGTTIYGATFTEEQQAEYFRIFGEETKKRGIFVCVFKLIDVNGGAGIEGLYGLFKEERDAAMNVPKLAALKVKDYLSVPLNKYGW